MALLPQARVHTAGLCSGCWCPPTPSSRITQPSLPGCPGYWLLMREAEFLPGIAFPSWESGPQPRSDPSSGRPAASDWETGRVSLPPLGTIPAPTSQPNFSPSLPYRSCPTLQDKPQREAPWSRLGAEFTQCPSQGLSGRWAIRGNRRKFDEGIITGMGVALRTPYEGCCSTWGWQRWGVLTTWKPEGAVKGAVLLETE